MRRNLDRRKLRQKHLTKFMIESGLMPADEMARKELENTDPWELRAKALDGIIPLHHLGRALFHISQRRGFKSNHRVSRKAVKGDVIGITVTPVTAAHPVATTATSSPTAGATSTGATAATPGPAANTAPAPAKPAS